MPPLRGIQRVEDLVDCSAQHLQSTPLSIAAAGCRCGSRFGMLSFGGSSFSNLPIPVLRIRADEPLSTNLKLDILNTIRRRIMSKSKVKYTLWTIPKSEWSHLPLQDIEISEADKNEIISFAKELDDERLNDRLRPFDTPVTQDTLNKSVGQK